MGASNALIVSRDWSHLPGDSFKVVLFMALITMDQNPNPTYWGATNPLVRAIGRDGENPTETDYRALRRAIKPAVDSGVLSVDKHAGPGHPPVYGLHLLRTESVRS